MAFCLKRILLLHVTLQSLTGWPVKQLQSNQADTVNKARDILKPKQANFLKRPEETKRNPDSTFKFLNQSELAKGMDYLKKKYPDVDWSLVTPLTTQNTVGKKEFKNSLEQTKKSSFTFLNDSEIAKGLDYLKKKYPDVDWSFVLPLPTSSNAGKRELQYGNSLRQLKRTFHFVNKSEIAKGFEYLKKKYPDVDWSFVMPLSTSSPGRRELKGQIMQSEVKSVTNKLLDQQKKGFFDSSNQQKNDIPGRRENSDGSSSEMERNDVTSHFEFIDPQKEIKDLKYLVELPEVELY